MFREVGREALKARKVLRMEVVKGVGEMARWRRTASVAL
jgi:hypothetical protein